MNDPYGKVLFHEQLLFFCCVEGICQVVGHCNYMSSHQSDRMLNTADPNCTHQEEQYKGPSHRPSCISQQPQGELNTTGHLYHVTTPLHLYYSHTLKMAEILKYKDYLVSQEQPHARSNELFCSGCHVRVAHIQRDWLGEPTIMENERLLLSDCADNVVGV